MYKAVLSRAPYPSDAKAFTQGLAFDSD